MRLTIALILASVPLLAVGGESLYHALANRQQTTVSCGQVAAEPPRASWLKVLNCHLDYEGAGYREEDGRISELFFPVRPIGQSSASPAPMIAATRNPEALAIAQAALGGGKQLNEEAYTVMMLRIVTAVHAAREVDGYVRRGLLLALPTRRTLAALHTPLAPGAVVIDLNGRPRVAVPAAVTLTGITLLAVAIVLPFRRRRPVAVEPAARVERDEAAAAPGIDRGGRLKNLMLLDLDPSAGREAIERAPPLGTRETVERRISHAMPGITFDEHGRGALIRPDVNISIDLASGKLVWTAVIQASGDGAASRLRTLLTETGWRIYAPQRGTFVNLDELELL